MTPEAHIEVLQRLKTWLAELPDSPDDPPSTSPSYLVDFATRAIEQAHSMPIETNSGGGLGSFKASWPREDGWMFKRNGIARGQFSRLNSGSVNFNSRIHVSWIVTFSFKQRTSI